ncbi:Intraflagellar transport protein 46-like protein [Aphelenchoides fujianensis]|nr:Intraflagellar transport protein 46-like protein [Aphelenchoides fujianensis]
MSRGSPERGGMSSDAVQPFGLSDEEESARKPPSGRKQVVHSPPSVADVNRPPSEWSSRPQSKPNLVQRLEAADLDEFERNERDILLAAAETADFSDRPAAQHGDEEEEEEERSIVDLDLEHSPPPFSPPTRHDLHSIEEEKKDEQEALPTDIVLDSVQNRQVDANLRQDSPDAFCKRKDLNERNWTLVSADESDDYPSGFPATHPPIAPPAYSSNPTTERPAEAVGPNSEGLGSVIQAGGLAASLAAGVGAAAIAGANHQPTLSPPAGQKPKMSRVSSDEEAIDGGEVVQLEKDGAAPAYRLSSDIRDLMHFVDSFEAERVEIQAVLRPFFLDYIPAVGDVDPFLKIPRPDNVDDQLGLVALDEPAAAQSDAAIMEMKLRQLSNTPTKQEDAPVKKLDRADKNQQHIEQWIKKHQSASPPFTCSFKRGGFQELRRSKPPDRVSYTRPMPDLERLMDEWPADLDSVLRAATLPTAKLDCSVPEFADLCLSLADIPVHGSRIHALHLLFSLYSEFKNSQHFRNLASNGMLYGEAEGGSKAAAERLEL